MPSRTLLRELDIPYVLLNPGSSFRGLHDSIVNLLGNERPQMLVCLHEEHAVAIAHGYAKVTGKPLLGIVHSNVGLMHASMAIYNAWCDRVPVILLGATGPVDAAKRRPWIDWLHTARDQAALVRGFVKWDDQPASVAAAFESLLRARQIAQTAPQGPVYVCLDVSTQEEKLAAMPRLPDPVALSAAAAVRTPRRRWCSAAAALLAGAARPVILMGRVSRDARGVGRARRARRAAWRRGPHRSEGGRGVSHRSSVARGAAGDLPRSPPRRAAARRRRRAEPRLGRSRGHAQAGVGQRRRSARA